MYMYLYIVCADDGVGGMVARSRWRRLRWVAVAMFWWRVYIRGDAGCIDWRVEALWRWREMVGESSVAEAVMVESVTKRGWEAKASLRTHEDMASYGDMLHEWGCCVVRTDWENFGMKVWRHCFRQRGIRGESEDWGLNCICVCGYVWLCCIFDRGSRVSVLTEKRVVLWCIA